MAEMYSLADVFLDPSDFQGFGRPGLEAMACGTPTVLTNQGGVLEYAEDRKNCLLVRPGHPADWVRVVQEILQSKTLREALIHNGLSKSREFDLNKEIETTKNYFSTLYRT